MSTEPDYRFFRKPKPLTRQVIEQAVRLTGSNRAAARYLGVSYPHYKRYASLYTDEKTGKNLYELHLNRGGKGIRKFAVSEYSKKHKGKEPVILDIINGRVPSTHFNPQKVKYQLIRMGMLKCECAICGFHEKRMLDGKMPLILHHKDGDKNNWHLDNLEFRCYNCTFLNGGVDCPISEDFVEKVEDALDRNGRKDRDIFELDDYQQTYLRELGLTTKDLKDLDKNEDKSGQEYVSRF